jgi:16S rRNA (guanine(966)-N(2))-methyltransferase RsmD
MLRITGGEFRGRLLKTPKGLSTRPTQARLRQALFNSVQTVIIEAKVLDLFAGSGALGFESLSRGASHVTFVEDSRQAIKLIEANAKELNVLDRIELISESVDRLAQRLERLAPFDLVLADPPYEEGWEMKLLDSLGWCWGDLLSESGLFCLEWGTQKSRVESLPDEIGPLLKVREKNYGDSVLSTYRRAENP